MYHLLKKKMAADEFTANTILDFRTEPPENYIRKIMKHCVQNCSCAVVSSVSKIVAVVSKIIQQYL